MSKPEFLLYHNVYFYNKANDIYAKKTTTTSCPC